MFVKTKKITILAAIILILAGIGYFWWLSGTPEYSVFQIRKAVETNDLELGLKYIDVDSVLENFWVKEIENMFLTGRTEELVELNAIFGLQFAEITKPVVEEQIRQGIENWFLAPAEKEPSGEVITSAVFPGQETGKIEVVKQNNTAYIERPDGVKVIFTKKEGERHWVVSEIEGLVNLLKI